MQGNAHENTAMKRNHNMYVPVEQSQAQLSNAVVSCHIIVERPHRQPCVGHTLAAIPGLLSCLMLSLVPPLAISVLQFLIGGPSTVYHKL